MKRYRSAFALVALLAVAGVALETLSGTRAPTGRAAPALPTQVLVPPRIDLASLRGRPALINFWASWCPPCRAEAPRIRRFSATLGSRARLVGVDWNDTVAGARSFLRKYGWRFPNLRDGSGVVGNNYGLAGLPTTFVLDRDGRIREVLRGPQTVTSLARSLRGAGA